MRILTIVLFLFTSYSILGQADGPEKFHNVSKEEARNLAKRDGYFLRYTKLDSNQWIIVYSKCVGYASSISPVYKNVSTTIDARTGKIKKKSRFNTLSLGQLANDVNPPMKFKKTKKMKVFGERIKVYH